MSVLVAEARRAPVDAFAIIGGLMSASGFLSLYEYEFGSAALRRVAGQFTQWSDLIWSAIGGVLQISVSESVATVLTLFVIGAGLCARGYLRRYPNLSQLNSVEIIAVCFAVAFVMTSFFRYWNLEFGPGVLGQTFDAVAVIVLGFLYTLYPRMLFGALIAAALLLGFDLVVSGAEGTLGGAA